MPFKRIASHISPRIFELYLALVSVTGLVLFGWALTKIVEFENWTILLLIFALALLSQFLVTTVSVTSEKSAIAVSIATAVSLASVSSHGPSAAVIIAAIINISMWLIRPSNNVTWKRSWQQLFFNTGMHIIAIRVAAMMLVMATELFTALPLLQYTIPWLLAALSYATVNFGLLATVLYLQHRQNINIRGLLRENLWAISLDILIMSIGSGMVAYAIRVYDHVGIVIFFMPVVLSAYAFHVYARRMREHLDNLETIVAERTEELKTLAKEKDAFLAVLTHDMKTPLTSIHLYAQMLQMDPSMLMKKPHLLRVILNSQQTLTDIVDNILDLEKLNADGDLPIAKDYFDLCQLVEYTVEMIQVQAEQKELSVSLDLPHDQLIVNADRKQIQRAISNMMANAVKYTDIGGKIDITVVSGNKTVYLAVKDTGAGIPEADLPYIFERFHRVVQHRTMAAGTGLGLAIVKAIVDAHDGTIKVESEVGVGSIFTLTLPLHTSAHQAWQITSAEEDEAVPLG